MQHTVILLVDDEKTVLDSLCAQLRRLCGRFSASGCWRLPW